MPCLFAEGRCKVRRRYVTANKEDWIICGVGNKPRRTESYGLSTYSPTWTTSSQRLRLRKKQECTLSHQRQECYSIQGRYLATLVVHEWLSRASPGLASWSPDAQWALKYLPNILYIWSDYKPINHYCSRITCRKLLIDEVQEIKKICKVLECNRIVANKCIQLGFMCKPELWGTQPNLFTWCKRLEKVAQRISTYCNQNLQAM